MALSLGGITTEAPNPPTVLLPPPFCDRIFHWSAQLVVPPLVVVTLLQMVSVLLPDKRVARLKTATALFVVVFFNVIVALGPVPAVPLTRLRLTLRRMVRSTEPMVPVEKIAQAEHCWLSQPPLNLTLPLPSA